MRSSSKRVLSLLIAALFFIAALVVYSNMVLPEYAAVNDLRAEYATKQQALEDQKQILSKVNELLLRYQSIPKLNEVLSMALPNTENVAGAFQQVFAIARSNALSIQQFGVNTSIGLKPAKEGGGGAALRNIGTAQLNVHLVGSYDGLKGFLQTMERNIRLMDLSDLRIQPIGGSNLFLFNVVINAYYQA